jgi:hypothetical protein
LVLVLDLTPLLILAMFLGLFLGFGAEFGGVGGKFAEIVEVVIYKIGLIGVSNMFSLS